ncbi:MAG: class I SAM-dependent methyltransferase [Halobacteriovoraceae bacterium]|jgi:SAM-dependent methyltransferase|nr:class I SAM-dependent methyltransferase [Halobacteriovoraceae bacterium]MBT5095887.1 class I SAM-dependent methyltransferase [Halobacteriovoraceae bacterium]
MHIRTLIEEKLLICPQCSEENLSLEADAAKCNACHQKYSLANDKIHFVVHEESPTHDSLDKIKTFFKKYPKLYGLLKDTVSPLYLKNDIGNFLRQNGGDKKVTVNLGSGNFAVAKNVFNLDLIAYDNVDIVSNLEKLPFKNDSVDLLIINSVLEHVPNPGVVVLEMERILRPGGKIFASVPFICGFHASPYDYTRWTREGVKVLFKDFQMEDLRPEGGPTSALLWVFQEWFATLFSFGSRTLFNLNYLLIMLLTWPFKYFDIFMRRLPTAHHIHSCFIFIGEKKAT